MRVLILDEGFVSGAITALGLRGAGCRVHVLAAVGGHARVESRGSVWELAPRVGDAGLIERVRELSPSFDVVYPVTEPLQELLGAPRRGKRATSALMRAAGIPVPDEADLGDVGAFGYPVVIKGDFGRGGCETHIVASPSAVIPSEARDLYFVQRYINGPTYLAGGVFDRGRALRFYMGQKTVQFPARTGPAAELLSVEDAGLRDVALRAFEVSGVSGIASADFIRDRNGRFLFLEMNPRPWGSMAAAAAAGVDLFTPLVALWRGEPVASDLRFLPGVRTPTFPLCLLTPSLWRPGDLARAARFASRELWLASHLAHRLLRMRVRAAPFRARQAAVVFPHRPWQEASVR